MATLKGTAPRFGLVFLLTLIFAASKHKWKELAGPDIYVALVSNKVPRFSEISWMLELSLISFLHSFRVSAEQVHLSVYMECSTRTLQEAQPYDDTFVEPEYISYVTSVVDVVNRVRASIGTVAFYCTSSLGQAVCHSKTAMFESGMMDGLFFLLEHDWIVLPSQIGASVKYIKQAMMKKVVQYVLLQRGDRAVMSAIAGYSELRVTDLYSNNPYFASFAFLERLTDESNLCKRTTEASWERSVEKYCKSHCSGLAVLRVKTKGSALYHVDGRYLSTAKLYSIGALFDSLQQAVQEFSRREMDALTLIKLIDIKCRKLPSDCDPYFHRRKFPELIRPLVVQRAGQGLSLEQVIAEFSGEDPRQFLSGKFKGRKELEEALQG